MVRLLIIVLCALVSACSPFTVDERSALHLGASGVIGVAVDETLYRHRHVNHSTSRERVLVSGTVCLVPGGFKEFVLDGHHDWGDMTFNAIGCYGLPYLNEKLGGWQVSAQQKDNTAMIVFTVRR